MKILKTTLCICLIFAVCACTGKTDAKSVTECLEQKEELVENVASGVVYSDLTLEQALEKAKSVGKYVFIDFHTKTCGPCKKMQDKVFSTVECGSYVNANFISIKIDGEDEGEGTAIAKSFDVRIFPTVLILDPAGYKGAEGTLVGQVIGAELNVGKFVDMLKEAVAQYRN